ncbi:12822_t:CDS:10 [Ambispora leptoticha]|uniref:short-chain 2-methylacyl-CoA dehydrogenase n=1 Tax=Ambispora leptoticha TaxID=144679 RepID=A0A9N9F4N3_9GLOM|nr:12822_t:CDS:10 [Ambispora leptoticha]
MSFAFYLKTNLPAFARRAAIYAGNKPRFFTQTALLRNASVFPSLNTLTEEEAAIRETVTSFAQEIILPKVKEMDEKESLDKEILKGLFDQGFMGIETEPEYGGSGSTFLSAILVVEELAKVDPAISVVCDVQNTLVNTLFRKYGSDALRKKYLPQLATGKVGCFCLSEESAGSDAFALKTRADKKGDHYEINGSKMWITNSYEAEIFLVFANIDFDAKHKGITCFVVEKDFGVKVAKKESKLGIRASSTCTLNFDGVKVPEENVLGEVGKGYKYAIEILNEGRIGIAAQMIGLAQGAFDHALPYTLVRKQFGQPVGEYQGMQFQYAQIATDIEAARLLTYNAARLKQEGCNFVKEAAMAKLFSSQVAEHAASKAIEWMGGVGFTREFPGIH